MGAFFSYTLAVNSMARRHLLPPALLFLTRQTPSCPSKPMRNVAFSVCVIFSTSVLPAGRADYSLRPLFQFCQHCCVFYDLFLYFPPSLDYGFPEDRDYFYSLLVSVCCCLMLALVLDLEWH